jgi:hypothetical protein
VTFGFGQVLIINALAGLEEAVIPKNGIVESGENIEITFHSLYSLGEDLVGVAGGEGDDGYDLVDEVVGDLVMEQVGHRIDEYKGGFFHLQRLD